MLPIIQPKKKYDIKEIDRLAWEKTFGKPKPKEEPKVAPVEQPEEKSSILQALEEPGRKFNEGLSKLGDNPIAGALDMATGLVNTALLPASVPFQIVDEGLRSIGANTVADVIAAPFTGASALVGEGTNQIGKGLEKVGITKEVEDAFWQSKGLTPKQTGEIAKSLDEVNQLAGQVLAGAGLVKAGAPIKKALNVETLNPKKMLNLNKEYKTKQLRDKELLNEESVGKEVVEKPKEVVEKPVEKTIETTDAPKAEIKADVVEKPIENTFKSWLESQPDVILEKKANLGTNANGEVAGAFTQKGENGFKVSYADYTPETSFAKEIGRVLSNKLDVEGLKGFEAEYKELGFKEGLLSDRFSQSVKELVTNPELKDKAPKLTQYLEEQKVPFQKTEAVVNSPIPEFPKTKAQRDKISAEFESNIKDKSHFNSLKKMTNDQDLNNYLDQVGKSVEKPRGVMTENVVNDLALTLGLTKKDVMKIKKGEVRNVEQVTGMKQVLVDNLNEMSKFVKEGGDKLTIDNAQKLKDMFLTHQAMQSKVMGLVSESARVLQSMNRKVDAREFDVLNEVYNKLKESGEDISKPEVFSKKIKEVTDPTTGDKATFWWYQSMLANPMTDVANITGNLGYAGAETFSRVLTEPQNIPEMMRGIKIGWKDAVKEIKEIYDGEKKELSKFDWDKKEFAKIYDPSPKNVQNALLQKLAGVGHIMLPTNRLKVEDAVFRNIARNIEREIGIKDIAKKTGESKDIVGSKLKELEDAINNELKDVKDLTDGEKLFYQSIQDYHKYARELTFTEPLGRTGAYFQRLTSSNALLKWTFPFIRVATNLVKEGLKHSPYYLGKSAVTGEFKNLSPRQKTTMIRRAVVGTSLMTALEYLQSNGSVTITGDGPTDRSKKEIWMQAGYKPNHIYFGDKGVPYNNINPFGILLAIRGNLSDFTKYDTKFSKEDNALDEKMSLLFGKVTNTFLSQSFMSGARDLLQSIKDGDTNLLAKIVSSPIPNIGGFEKALEGDRTMTEKSSFWDVVGSKAYNKELPAQIDIKGEPKQSGYRRFPWETSDKGGDKVMNYLLDNDIRLGIPSRPKVGNREATDEEYRKYKEISGKRLYDRLNRAYPMLKRLNKEIAQKYVKKWADLERDNAKEIIKQRGNK